MAAEILDVAIQSGDSYIVMLSYQRVYRDNKWDRIWSIEMIQMGKIRQSRP